MAEKKISDIFASNPASAVLGPMQFVVNNAGTTEAATAQQIDDFINPSDAPFFVARKNTAHVISTSTPETIIFNVEDTDSGGDYDNSTGIFTAPIAGDYLFTVQATNDATSTAGDLFSIRIATTARNLIKFIRMNSIQTVSHSFSVMCAMDAADTAQVQIARTGGSGSFTFAINGQLHWFTGKLIK